MKTKRQKFDKARPDKTPTKLTRKAKLQICGSIILILAFIIIPHTIHVRYEKQIFAEKLDRKLQHWRASFHLDDRQVNLIRQMEVEFHGNGNSLTRPFRSIEEEQKHRLEIAGVMGTEDGRRFLESQKQH